MHTVVLLDAASPHCLSELNVMRVTAVIPAAGCSSRMGSTNKLTLPFAHSTILQSTLSNILHSTVTQTIVVLGYEHDYWLSLLTDPRLDLVINHHWQKGMASSIITGLYALKDNIDAIIIIPADMPLIKATLIDHIIEYAQHKAPDMIVATRHSGRRGHPVLFPSRLLAEMCRVMPHENGLRTVINDNYEQLSLMDVDDESIFLDIDGEENYLRILNKYRQD